METYIREYQLTYSRAASGARQLPALIATDKPILTKNLSGGRPLLIALVLDGAQIPPNVPLLTDHARSVPNMVGSVLNFGRDTEGMTAALSFAEGTPAADEAWSLASQRHLRAVSVGFSPIDVYEIRPGGTAVVSGRSYTAPPDMPLFVYVKWNLTEVSLVPQGADPACLIRSHSLTETITNMPASNLDHLSFVDYARQSLANCGRALPENDRDVIRAALSNVDGAGNISGLVGSAILSGYRQSPDSTVGWVRTVNLPDFNQHRLTYTDTPCRLSRIGRHATAVTVNLGVSDYESWRLARFACQFALDEQSLEDTQELGLLLLALEEIGAASRRVIPDLVYSVLLSNPTLADGAALFAAGRSNYGTGGSSALDATALDTAIGAIGGQTLTDANGDGIHVNLSPRYLICQPAKLGAARRAVRNMALGDGSDLIVRSETRLSGVVNPLSDHLQSGNSTGWLLAASADQAPSFAVGLLDGKAEPTIRTFTLDRGEWGIGVDVSFDVAVKPLDGKPLYYAVGA